jgi:crotonobetainyl-CoA:carnitine CoA-transferase CaiB-like acyl-CoA transferase
MAKKRDLDPGSPLEGIRVLEVANWLAAPAAAAVLADMGADVIKVEPPRGDAWRHYRPDARGYDGPAFTGNPGFNMDNRGKRSIAINLDSIEGRELVFRLAKQADIFITNLIPRRAAKFGLSYAAIRRQNPRIIFLQFTGFGERGPEKDKLGFDYVGFWARSGIMANLGEPDAPPVLQRPGMGDHATALGLAAGLIAALYHRDRTGKGQHLQGSLLHTGLWVLGADVQVALETGREPRRRSRKQPQHALWNTYRTKDGEWIMLAAPNMTFWPRICRALELGDLVDDPELQTIEGQIANSARVTAAFEAAFAARTLRQLKPRLDAEDLLWSAVAPIRKAIADRQAALNDMIGEVPSGDGAFRTINMPVRFSESRVEVRGPAPAIGQHTEEVLLEAGLGWDEIAALRDSGAIG